MIHHVVMWKFKDTAEGASREANLRKAKTMLESLVGRVPEIRSFQVGIDMGRTDASYDMVLTSEFSDMEALKRYQAHPEHVRVAHFLRKVQVGRAVVDFSA